MYPKFVTTHVAVPSPIPIYANDRPISTWDGTTHTADIVYANDDSYDGRTNYNYAYGDSFNMIYFKSASKPRPKPRHNKNTQTNTWQWNTPQPHHLQAQD